MASALNKAFIDSFEIFYPEKTIKPGRATEFFTTVIKMNRKDALSRTNSLSASRQLIKSLAKDPHQANKYTDDAASTLKHLVDYHFPDSSLNNATIRPLTTPNEIINVGNQNVVNNIRTKWAVESFIPLKSAGGDDIIILIVQPLTIPIDQVYELEEFRRSRLDSLACLIQTKFRGYSKRKEFLSLRNSQIIISSAWRTWRECRFGVPFSGRRHLWCLYKVAREEYRQQKYRKQMQWAISVIQRQYLQWKRRHFLLTLLLHLPPDSLSPLSSEWTAAPAFLAETSLLLRNIYHRWRCYKYRLTFDQTARNRMREKVTASIIFKDRKSSYPRSVAHPFLGDYVRLRHNSQWRKLSIDSSDQYVVFADIINKIARSSGKFVPILLVLSTSSMLLLDQRTLQIKYRVPATEIYRLSLSPYLDNIAVFHVKAFPSDDCDSPVWSSDHLNEQFFSLEQNKRAPSTKEFVKNKLF